MPNKKGMTIPMAGTVFLIITVVAFSFLGLFSRSFEGENIEQGGLTISLSNHLEFWRKSLDESMQIISKRAAYDLGKNGGIEGKEIAVWNKTYPSITVLKDRLERKIKDNIPKGSIEDGRRVEWRNDNVSVSGYNTVCGPIKDSKCFLIDGYKEFSIYDKTLDSNTFLNYTINSSINSSYFKLLNAGRAILENNTYVSLLVSDRLLLEQTMKIIYGVDASILINGQNPDYLDVTLSDDSCIALNEFYCIVPAKPPEPSLVIWNGATIPYDYLYLHYQIYQPGLGGVIEVHAYNSSGDEVQANVTIIDEGFKKRGDFNRDGVINITDVNLLIPWWGKFSPPAPPEIDLNNDGFIDLMDISRLGINFGRTAPSLLTNFTWVIEPGNCTLIATYKGANQTKSVIVPLGTTQVVNFNFS